MKLDTMNELWSDEAQGSRVARLSAEPIPVL